MQQAKRANLVLSADKGHNSLESYFDEGHPEDRTLVRVFTVGGGREVSRVSLGCVVIVLQQAFSGTARLFDAQRQ
jgi:hypothetical protein